MTEDEAKTKVKTTATVQFGAHIKLTETEIRALDALVGYGDDAFLNVFGGKLGHTYMRDHADGLKAFFASVRGQVLPALAVIDQARKLLAETGLAGRP
jgi:hypothetical protein